MAKKSKYDLQACVLISKLGYSYQDIADVYSNSLKEPCHKSAISKILSPYNINKIPVRVNPRTLQQKYIDLLQSKGLYLSLLELYNYKYTKPVKDTKFKSNR